MKYDATIGHAQEASDKGILREWVIDYLDDTSDGKNARLANTIREHQDARIILREYPLHKLQRMLGPEPSMLWLENEKKWRSRVDAIKLHASRNNLLPPLIATDFWDDLHLADGSHRHQALLELGNKTYWTIFCLDDPTNIAVVENA